MACFEDGIRHLRIVGSVGLLLAACSGPTEPPANAPPRARIDAPADPAPLLSTDTLRLSGSATDDEDGDLDGAALAWRSDVAGDLGTGRDLEAWGLAVGDHWVSLTATDSDGDTGTDSLRVTVENAPPEARITAPSRDTTVTAGETVTFEGSAEDPEDGAVTGDALAWTSDLDGELGTGEHFEATLSSDTTHVITLTATDGAGAAGQATVSVTVADGAQPPPPDEPPETPPANQPPAATITAPVDGATFDEDADVTFEGSAIDPEDGALAGTSLVWSSDLDGELGTGKSLTTTSLSVGDHTVALTATDTDGAMDSAIVSVTVEFTTDEPPTVTITSPADRTAFDEGEPISLQGSASDREDGRLTGGGLVWTSDVDGELGTGERLVISILEPGPHTITLTGTDSEGHTTSASLQIVVEAPGFSVRLRFLSEFTEAQKGAMEAAADRWEAVVTSDLSPFFPSPAEASACKSGDEGIDDVVATVQSVAIDGPGGVRARAGGCLTRLDAHGNFSTTIQGNVQIDEADMTGSLSFLDIFGNVFAHELGHVLGIGSLWAAHVSGRSTGNLHHTGSRTGRAFRADYDGEAYLGPGVPLQPTGAHWDGFNFGFELMSSFGGTPLSRVSIAALEDAGYTVDYGAADDFSLPMPQVAVWPASMDATLSRPASSGDNFGVPDGSLVSESLVVGTNNGIWSTDPDEEAFLGLLSVQAFPRERHIAIVDAEIELHVRERDAASGPGTIELKQVTGEWAEQTVTWDARPSLAIDSLLSFEQGSCDFCVLRSTSLIQLAESWTADDGIPNLGLALVARDADPLFSVGYWSRHANDVSLRPSMTVWAQIRGDRRGPSALRVLEDTPDAIPYGDDILPGPVFGVTPTGAVRRIGGGR